MSAPSVSPHRSNPSSSDPLVHNSRQSAQYAPQKPTSPPASDTTTSYSVSLDTTLIWETLRAIKQWFSDQFDALISCFCSKPNSEHIEQTHLPEEIQQLIAPLKDWLESDDEPSPAINFDHVKFDQTLIDTDAMDNDKHEQHEATLDRLKGCTEPTCFLSKHHNRPAVFPCIIIPIEIKTSSDSDYRPDFIEFFIDPQSSWVCANSQRHLIAEIKKDGSSSEFRFWLTPLLKTGTAQDNNNDVMYRLKSKASKDDPLE